MTKPNLCWAKWAIGKRVWGVSNDCDQRKARFKKRLESTAWPPVKRNTVYMCTFIHMHKHGFLCRHMYTVHRTHGSSGWLIQQHIRSLTVTNSWKTDEHKKAHTLTPNLWGGLGQRRRGSDLAAGLSPSQLLFLFSPFFPLHSVIYFICITPLLSACCFCFTFFSSLPTSGPSSVSLQGILSSLPLLLGEW